MERGQHPEGAVDGYRRRRIAYLAGLCAALVVAGAATVDASWVFRVFLEVHDRRISLDTNGDGRPDYLEIWENGEMVRAEWDRDYNGVADFVNDFANGDVTRVELDADFDGYFEYREILEPGSGRYRQEKDEDRDGTYAVLGHTTMSGDDGAAAARGAP